MSNLSPRLARIKDRLFNVEMVKKKEWWGKGTTVLDQPGILNEPLIIRKARAIEYVCRYLPAEIKPDELIVGMPNMASVGFGKVFPEYATPKEKADAAKSALNEMSVWGHHPVRYDRLLSEGLQGFRRDALRRLTELKQEKSPDQEKVDFYRACIITLNAVRDFARRYADLALQEALRESDPHRASELLEISRICMKVPEQPAESFWEALQSFWLAYAVFHSCLEYLPMGRGDQYLWPYLEQDLREGKITMEEARDLVGSFLVKFNERVHVKLEHWEDHYTFGDFSQGGDPVDPTTMISLDNAQSYNYGISGNHWLMNLILGGLTPDGGDGTNELTYLFLDLMSEMELLMPVVSVRFHKDSPFKLLRRCAEILRCGSGEPAIYNDETIIKGLLDLGIPLEEARDYSNDGCWEVLIPGKTEFTYFHIEVLLCLEYVLQRGKSLVRGVIEGLDTGDPDDFGSFGELYEAFRQQVYHWMDRAIQNKLKHYGAVFKIAPDPLLSSMMDDCMEKGLDLTQGGARYIFYSPLLTGLSNCVDSLVAIRKFVFEERRLKLGEIAQATARNFEGQEALRQLLINRAPKYGNDLKEADELVERILRDVVARRDYWQEKFPRFRFPLGIGTFESYARFGNRVGASADGRLSQETLSSNYSPSVGMDKSGPTAAIRSATFPPSLFKYVCGCPLDLQINANETAGETGVTRLAALIKSFLDLGGNILTITGVSEELLRDAQKHPDRHRGLRVRLGGLSAYFIALPPKHQEIMIERVKHGL